MTKSIQTTRILLGIFIPIMLLTGLVLLIRFAPVQLDEKLTFAFSFDLLLTVPVIYFFLIRKSRIPNISVVPVMMLGMVVGMVFMPEANRSYLIQFKTFVLPIIELSVVGFVIYKVRKAVVSYKSLQKKQDSTVQPDFFNLLKEVCSEIMPAPVVAPFAMEIAVFYYGFFNWKKRSCAENEFTYHRESGAYALFGALILIIGVETYVLHILLEKWSVIMAWIVSGLSVYTGLQLFGSLRAFSKRPYVIETDGLVLRNGIMSETFIPFNSIKTIEKSDRSMKEVTGGQSLSLLGELQNHNVVVEVDHDLHLHGLYGLKKSYTTLGFHVDQPEAFLVAVIGQIEKQTT